MKRLDHLLNQYEGKLTEVIDKKARHDSNGTIQNDRAASGKARMASQVGHRTTRTSLRIALLLSLLLKFSDLQLFALVPIFLLQFTYGMNTGFPAILTPQLAEEGAELTISADEESWIVSLDNLATPLVCVASGCLQQLVGPKTVLLASCFPYVLAWITCAQATGVHQLYLSRVLVGFSHALVTTTVYPVEIASKEMRGTFSLWESVLR